MSNVVFGALQRATILTSQNEKKKNNLQKPTVIGWQRWRLLRGIVVIAATTSIAALLIGSIVVLWRRLIRVYCVATRRLSAANDARHNVASGIKRHTHTISPPFSSAFVSLTDVLDTTNTIKT
jgi:hypothetical protein